MPVEIREIVISASIEDQAPLAPAPAVDVNELRADILAECAELIRKAIERQWDR